MRTCGKAAAIVVLTGCAALAGCATSRSEVKLATPTASAQTAAMPANGKTIYIRSVTDQRVFEDDPSNPSIPSLGFGGPEKATADVKARAIGRKRNSFGHAEGDVLLKDGQTVTGVIQTDLTAALEQAGYKVVTNAENATTAAIVMDVGIKQFWAWFRPGFWEITLTANISTDLSVQGEANPIVVTVQAKQEHMAATDSDWIGVISDALKKYQEQMLQVSNKIP